MASVSAVPGAAWLTADGAIQMLLRTVIAIVAAFLIFGVFMAVTGRDPLEVYGKVFQGTLGSKIGLSEVGVRMIPFVLTALATALPARVGLINVGGEGQRYAGAWAATGAALFLAGGPLITMIPLMVLAGFLGGAAWAGLAMVLRIWRGVNEVISTLLLNFVAVLFVNVFVFGPWKNEGGFGYPYTENFTPNAILPTIAATRFHWGFVLPVVGVIAVYFVLKKTSWGYNIRAIGGNPDAAQRRGIPTARYLLIAMLVGGGIAGIAGMAEVSGIQHHLRPGISNNFGFMGFLASWLGEHNPIAIVGAGFLLALVFVGGDLLQFSANLPSAAMNILIGLILFMVLGFRRWGGVRRT
ncbi:MAG: ABC transporter permease [Dehalococcoidia bacterium]|nr:ABC transporter permease [Dehalococcoidia bacterium]